MNKINSLFANSKDKKLLSLYFCAGCPTLEGTADVILTMQRRGIAMIEVGIPFSDPLADGPVIQSAATQALKNGMNLKKVDIIWLRSSIRVMNTYLLSSPKVHGI